VVNPARIIEELNRAGVEYVVIGGVAATLHGCPEQTYDLDIFSTVMGLQNYEAARNGARELEIEGLPGRALDLPLLITAKEVAADPNPRKRAALDFLKELQKRLRR
jgi:hypothetical protein